MLTYRLQEVVMQALVIAFVIRSENSETFAFYEGLGLDFRSERHGRGPVHEANTTSPDSVFEIYPASKTLGDMLVIAVNSLDEAESFLIVNGASVKRTPAGVLTKDPDGRDVMLMERD